MLFLDIDDKEWIGKALEHLSTHNMAWWRKSVHGNIHAIVFDSCETCKRYSDIYFDGSVFFNNQSQDWAEAFWTNPKTHVKRRFPSVTTLRLITSNSLQVYCRSMALFQKYHQLDDSIYEGQILYYTFQSVLINKNLVDNEGTEVFSLKLVISKNRYKTIRQIVDRYHFQKYEGDIKRMAQEFDLFNVSIPVEYQMGASD